ncbi:MAG: diguanylate cyclase DgcP [Rhodanobacter sp.]
MDDVLGSIPQPAGGLAACGRAPPVSACAGLPVLLEWATSRHCLAMASACRKRANMQTAVSPMALEELIGRLVDSMEHGDTLEALVRPLLELLEAVTGLESTYLTTVDQEAGLQSVMYARNTSRLGIPEGLTVPWEDTLCRRALDEKVSYTDDVAGRWGDSAAARELGIATYVSVPVRTAGGKLFGTLCAASDERKQERADAITVMRMFSQIIARQVEREGLLDALRKANVALAVSANTDDVTRLPNRRALIEEMRRRIQAMANGGKALLVAFVDLDGFKGINDRHGHDVGDRFLIAIGGRLQGALRDGDFVARLSGDEFVVLSGTRQDATAQVVAAVAERLQSACSGHFALDDLVFDYPGPSIGVAMSVPGETDAEALLARADAEMYKVKHRRRESRGD